MRSIMLVLTLFSVVFSSCKDCKKDGTGEYQFENSTSDNIIINIEGFDDFTVFATGEKTVTIPEGRYAYEAITDDFSYYWDGHITVQECETGAIELIK